MVSYLNMAEQNKYCAFQHASHNLNAHNFIKKEGKFNDWEVTTAFYASLKFFEGCLFPESYNHPDISKQKTVEFESYNSYRTMFNRFVRGTPHEAMKHFVKNNTNEDIWFSYRELYDVCHHSRYKNYIIKSEDLIIAQESLEEIRLYCNNNIK